MVRPVRAAAAAALAALALTASDACVAEEVVAYAEGRPEIDYDAFRGYAKADAEPSFRALARESLALARQLHEVMASLAAGEGDPQKSRAAREEAREILARYRDNKATLLRCVDQCLKTPSPAESDLEILRRLRETELQGLLWDKTRFIDCLRDIAGAMKLRFVMHPDVLKFNTVEAQFRRTSADGVLRAITTGFDCDAIVHDGEVVVIKSLKRNDVRLQKYLDEHPDWRYWEPEKVKEVEDDL